MPAAWEALFDELAELEPTERHPRLVALGATDPDLGRFLSKLLEADATQTELLATPLTEQAPRFAAEALAAGIGRKPRDRAGERIGRWRLLSLLGRGGMAEVWLAERADGEFEQRAAVKLLRPDLGSASIHARFLRERRILARLEHPGIARLLDGGRSEQGESYFVLEYVDGIPITTWCAEHAATLARKLDLLIEVCTAVEVAHRSLVVHRDLKPSNVLVDSAGRARLLDFGIAKLLEPEAPQAAELLTTGRGSLVLTPAYAAPEQLAGEPATTATDVYTLGLLMRELLTGEKVLGPYKPQLGNDLDAVLLRALDPDPARRYPGAAELGEDLRRFLDSRPLRAHPPTLPYLTRCFVRRHRWGVAAGLLVVLSLVSGLTAALWQARRAEIQAASAAAQARRAERVLSFLVDVFREADPSRTRGATITAQEILATGAARVEAELGTEPEVQAELLDAIAQVEHNLGLLDTARERAERALALRLEHGEPASATAASRMTLAEVLLELGEFDATETQLDALPEPSALDPALRRRRDDLRIGLLWQRGYAEAALAEAKRTIAQLESTAAGGADLVRAQMLLVGLLNDTSRVTEAIALARKALALAERTPELSRVELALYRRDLAEVLSVGGELDASEQLFASAASLLETTVGPNHPEVGFTEIKRGFLLLQRRRYPEAERSLQRAIEILRPFDHYEVGAALRYLGMVLLDSGRPREAEQRFVEAEAIFRRKLEPDHIYFITARQSHAQALIRLGRLDEAETMLREVVAAGEQLGPAGGYILRSGLKYLGEARRLQGDPGEALALHRRARAIDLEVFGTTEHVAVAVSNLQIALDLLALGRREDLAEASALVEPSIRFLERTDPQSPRLAELLAVRTSIAKALS